MTENTSHVHLRQMNQITHYLDGSNIYGSSEEEAEEVRLFRGGLLKEQGRNLLPPHHEAMECESRDEGMPCFLAGERDEERRKGQDKI